MKILLRPLLRALCASSLAWSASATAATWDAPPLEATRDAYLKALKDLEARFAHCRGSGLYLSFRVPKDIVPSEAALRSTPRRQRWIEFSSAGDRRKQTTNVRALANAYSGTIEYDLFRNHFEAGEKSVTAYNRDYSFAAEQHGSEFVVKSLEAGDKAGKRSLGLFSFIDDPVAYARVNPIAKIFERKGFHLDGIAPIGPDADSPLRMDFSFPDRLVGEPSIAYLRSGWLVVDPRANWLLREYGIVFLEGRNNFPVTEVGTVGYEGSSDGQMLPKEVLIHSFWGTYSKNPETFDPPVLPKFGEEFHYADFRFGDEPRENFTLGAYGLPEFGQTVAQVEAARSFPWWTVGAAVGFGALAVGLRRWAARRSAVAGPTAG